ncbi:hypothetical protein LBMAG56_37000 [Verrucomicrobiota bacterium]|nr:hypothetical protein LBMAG56_37000 [Verrucomicrobiota bacterium]
MAKTKTTPPTAPSLVVVPPPPVAPPEKIRAAAGKTLPTKRPLDPRENPAARDSRGTATRAEIRRESPQVTAPRASGRRPERSGQPRSKISKPKAG